jgi:hypothetical protein
VGLHGSTEVKMICMWWVQGLVKCGLLLGHSIIILNGRMVNLSITVGEVEVRVMEKVGA